MLGRYWWIQVFLRSFSHYVLLPAVLLLIGAMLVAAPWFGFGASVGVPAVITHDDLIKRLVIGISFGLLWVAALYCGYLLWLQDCREKRVQPPLGAKKRDEPDESPPAAEPAKLVSFRLFALKISGCFVVATAVIVLLIAGANRILPSFANILHNPLPVLTPEEIPEARADGDEPGCDENAGPPSRIQRVLEVYGAFLGTIAMCLLLGYWFSRTLKLDTPEHAEATTQQDVTTDWAWLSVWIVIGFLLIALTWGLNPDAVLERPLMAGCAIGIAILFRELRLWLASSDRPAEAGGPVTVAIVLVLLAIYAVAMFVGVTWMFSKDWVWGWSAWLVAVAATRLVWHVASGSLDTVRHWLDFPAQRALGPAETAARKWGRRLGLLGVAIFILLCAVPQLQSPVPFLCFLVYGHMAIYALLSLYLHRALFAVGMLVFVLFIISGIQAYHYRFPGLSYTQDALALLSCCKQEDSDQLKLEQRMAEYHALLKKHDILRAFKEAQDNFDDPDLAEKVKQLLLLPDVTEARDKLLAEWRERESKNQVIPVRIPPRPFMELFKWPPDDRMPVQSKSLIAIEEIHFEPGMPVVVVAVSGGGIRSAAWAYVVLQELELHFAKHNIDFPRQVRLVTGASGGMMGASYYVEQLGSPLRPKFPLPEDEFERKTQIDERRAELRLKYCGNLTKDCLTPIMQQMVLGDFPCFLSPWHSRYDRGKALEDAWKENLQGNLDRTFASFKDDEMKGKRPFLVFTPMMVEDGRRLIVSNLDMRTSVLNDGNLLPGDNADPLLRKPGIYSREALELFRMFPGAADTFRLSTAVRMSASFPFFSPAVPLPTAPRRRIVDAGYYDNYGVSLASGWLFSKRNADVFRRKTSQAFLLVQIRDTLSDKERALTKIRNEPAISSARAMEELTSPFEGLFNSRDGSSSFRNDGQLELLSQFIKAQELEDIARGDASAPRFNVVTFELDRPAPLSWYLSSAERDDVLRAIRSEGHKQRLDAAVDWWQKVRPAQ